MKWKVLAKAGMILSFFIMVSAPRHGVGQALHFDRLELKNGEALVRVKGTTNQFFRLDSSTNLSQWIPIANASTGIAGTNEWVDSAALYLASRFYRAEALTNPVVTGDFLATTNGPVLIRPVRHASFVLIAKDVVIYNDPVGPATRFAGCQRPT